MTVTATDTTGASGSATFTWTINPAAANTVTVTNPGNQTGTVGTAVSLQISATDSASGQTLTYSATGLPAGLSIISSSGLISGTPTTAGHLHGDGDRDRYHRRLRVGRLHLDHQLVGCRLYRAAAARQPGLRDWSHNTVDSHSRGARQYQLRRPRARGPLASLAGRLWQGPHGHLAQKVAIPATCKSAVLTYWVEVNSNVTSKTLQAQNKLVLEVLNSSGTVLQTVPVATAANHGTKYVEYTTNLASYIGQTITLKFVGTEVNGGNTAFFEDSNALNVH